jgi:hypothetical protein
LAVLVEVIVRVGGCGEVLARQRIPADNFVSSSATGCWGLPPKTAAISLRHQASFIRGTAGSVTSSTTSSTSRQNAYSAVMALRLGVGRKRKV